VVGEDHVRAGAADARERFQHVTRCSSIQPFAGRRLHHRVLAADVVGGDGHVDRLLHGADDVEVRQGRFHHDDVGAFGDVELHLADGLVAVAGSIW
jgi:hypothetical protein